MYHIYNILKLHTIVFNELIYGKTTSLSNLDDNNHCVVKNRFNLFIIYNKLVKVSKNVKLTFHNLCTFKIAYSLLSYMKIIITF